MCLFDLASVDLQCCCAGAAAVAHFMPLSLLLLTLSFNPWLLLLQVRTAEEDDLVVLEQLLSLPYLSWVALSDNCPVSLPSASAVRLTGPHC
jgi:hypothetical protein